MSEDKGLSTKEILLTFAGSIVLFAVLGVGVFGDGGLKDLDSLKDQYCQVIEKNDSLRVENKTLLYEIDRLNKDLEYVGNLARRELGYVSEDEFVFKSRTKSK